MVSDTSWPDYKRIPGLEMQGYAQMAEPPARVFIQAGAGGVAAAVAAHLHQVLGDRRPFLVVAGPARAACVLAAAQAGRVGRISTEEPTVMAMLACGETSPVAWRVLARLADGFMAVGEADAVEAMRRLARPSRGDLSVVAGQSGGAGLLHATRDPDLSAEPGLDARARVLLFNTEGATDPARYRELVGLAPPG